MNKSIKLEKLVKYLSSLREKYNLKTHILTSFLAILLLTFFSVFAYSFFENKHANIELGESFVNQSQKNIVERIEAIFTRTQVLAELLGESYNKEEEINPENFIIIGLMQEILNNHSYLTSVYAASKNSRFLEVKKVLPNDCYHTDAEKKLPSNAAFVVRFIDTAQAKPKEIWIYIDQNKKTLDTETVEKTNFHFKNEEWYKEVEQNHVSYWSDVYLLPHSKSLGLTVSTVSTNEYTNEFAGVIGIDIAIDRLSEILQQNIMGSDSSIFITNDKGELIAHSNSIPSVKDVAEKKTTNLILHSSDSKLKKMWDNYLESKKNIFEFDDNGTNFIGVITPFPKIASNTDGKEQNNFNKDWKVGSITNENMFIGKIKEVQKKTITVSFLFLLFSALLVVYIANKISNAINILSEEANKIKNFDLSGTNEVKTPIYELRLLNDSIVAMRLNIRTFAKFIPKELVGKLLKHNQNVKVGGRSQLLTLFFTDIANFTSICESYPADKLSTHLSEYFEEVTSIIFKYNGTIDKYIGDAVMGFWGAPNKDKDQALNACKAALAIQKKLRDLNKQWAAQDKPVFNTRIGIHVGHAIVGNMGSSDRMNYTALGDNVNLAARLEGTNKIYNTNVIISETTLKEVGENCLVRPLDIVSVKGKQQGVAIYELVGITHGEPTLLPSKEQVAFCALFTKGFQLYMEQRWDESAEAFNSIKKKFGEDYTVDLYLKRCKDFKKNPPSENWNGVITLKEK